MAVFKRSQIRVDNCFFMRFRIKFVPFFLLTISGTLQHPLFKKLTEDDIYSYIGKQWLHTPDDSWAREELYDLIMKPQLHHLAEINKESRTLPEQYIYQSVDRHFNNDVTGLPILNDDEKHNVFINSLNEIDMDSLSKIKNNNVSILHNEKLSGDNGKGGTILVTWDSAAIPEDWWSICQLPIFVILLAVIGVLAISSVILLWLKNQMLQSEKHINLTDIDSSKQMKLMSGSCQCPNQGLASKDQWICHTVINLKSPDGNNTDAVQVQPQEGTTLREVVTNTIKSLEKKPEAVRIKAKGLLERRGSSASLKIDLSQTLCDSKPNLVTPTRECTNEEFLLSAGNVLSRSQLKRCLKNVQTLHTEFWEIPLNHPEKSSVTGCGTKNRYESILPNEGTRVKLASDEKNPLDSYINANYIRGYDGEEKAYIATQGPLPNTIQDLYRMAWNDRSPAIVMITKLYEKAKIKCESYFPTDVKECIIYGEFQVTVMSVKHKQGYHVRELLIQKDCEKRIILHYWYDTWPDHKTPQNAHSIVAMATEVENYRTTIKNSRCPNNNEKHRKCDGPVIVHCSAGIGRTGCFIAISLAICQLLEEDKVDILGIVCQMRCDRGGMIQTAEQYEFVHRAIALFELSLPDSVAEYETP